MPFSLEDAAFFLAAIAVLTIGGITIYLDVLSLRKKRTPIVLVPTQEDRIELKTAFIVGPN